jgi:hypothetical protein
MGEIIAQSDDFGVTIDNPESVRGFTRDEQSAIIRAEINRRKRA